MLVAMLRQRCSFAHNVLDHCARCQSGLGVAGYDDVIQIRLENSRLHQKTTKYLVIL